MIKKLNEVSLYKYFKDWRILVGEFKFTTIILSTETTGNPMPLCYEICYKILSTVAALILSCIFPEDDIFMPKHVGMWTG